MGKGQRKAERPDGELRIVGEIRHDLILGPEHSDSYIYEYQEEYALLLWALQEKVGLTFEEATFVGCDKLRTAMGSDFFEDKFGMDFYEYGAWFEYFKSLLSGVDLTRYIGKIEPNYYESSVFQWFRGGAMKKKERERKVRYCTRLWLLQEIAGCTFLEARAYLRRERNETVASLAEAYSISEDDVLAAIASAEAKAAEAEAGGDLFHGYGPMYPDPDESIDWRRRLLVSTA